MTVTPSVTIGVSLKLYLDAAKTAAWSAAVAEIALAHQAVTEGRAALFVLPSLSMVPSTMEAFAGTEVEVGAQDLFWEDRGAYTGAVSGADLAELGCRLVEIGHAERRAVFGEDEHVAARKLAAAFRNGLRPVICLGEADRGRPEDAAEFCVDRLRFLLETAAPTGAAPVIVAYEPEWAIGASEAAEPEHVRVVTAALQAWLAARRAWAGSVVIYGGSAGPGTLPTLYPEAHGLFLGRFAHDPAALERILDEVLAL